MYLGDDRSGAGWRSCCGAVGALTVLSLCVLCVLVLPVVMAMVALVCLGALAAGGVRRWMASECARQGVSMQGVV